MRKRSGYRFIRKAAPVLLVFLFCIRFSCCSFGDDVPEAQAASAAQAVSAAQTASADSGIRLKIDYGYRNTAKTGQLLPVTITIDNQSGEQTDGFLSVDIPGKDGSISYTTSIRIPVGTTALKRTVTIPDGITAGDGDRLAARLFDDSGAEIASAECTVTYLGSGREVFCGILSDDQQNLLYLGNVSLGEGLSTRVVTLNPADLPENEDGLNQLDIILTSSIDLNRLSETTVKAVMDWVESGGTLIIGTGDTRSPLGAFRTLIGNPELGLVGNMEVDMGMQYSTTGPDGAVLTLPVRSVSWDGAKTILESGERDLVLRKEFGKGSVCITAYDLCMLKTFCSEHPAFTQDLLTAAVGQTGLARISGSLLSSEERLKASVEMTNTYDESRIPGMTRFAAVAVLFVLLAGMGLYHVLASRGLGTYYMLGVLILSTAFALLLWISSSSTGITGPFIRYGVITEFSVSEEGAVKTGMKGYIDLQSNSVSPVTLELPEDCMVRPVITNGAVSVTTGKKKMLAVTGQKQFETNIFQVEQKTEDRSVSLPLHVELNLGENGYSGTVANTGTVELSGLALLVRGEIFCLGKLKPGEKCSFGSETSLRGPVLLGGLVSSVLAEQEKDAKYALQRNSLRTGFFRENVSLSEGKALILGFAENYRPSFLERTEYDTEGSSMFVMEIPVPAAGAQDAFLILPETDPRVVSGSYDASTGCLKGSGATILEYSLGSGYQLNGIRLESLSAELEGKGVTAFTGQISMYNYSTGSFDLVDAGKIRWSVAELKPYLSPANNLTLRFLPDEERKGSLPVYLPRLYVEGSPGSAAPGGPSHAET